MKKEPIGETRLKVFRPVLEKYHPLGNRELCYTLEAMGKIKHNEFSGYIRAIRKARDNGKIPMEWICDESRSDYYIPIRGYKGIEDFMNSINYMINEGYRLDFWTAQPNYVELILEKIGLAHFYKPLCEKYYIRIIPSKGDSSYSQCYQISQRLKRYFDLGKKLYILYLGDFNWNGWNTPKAILRKVIKYGGFKKGELEFKRIGINPHHILKYPNLPTDVNPVVNKSTRTKRDNFLKEMVERFGHNQAFWDKNTELEALKVWHPDEHLKEVEKAITDLIDFDIWKDLQKKSEDDKKVLRDRFKL